MIWLLCILFPPLAVFMCKKPIQAIINLVLWFFLIVPAMIHAFFVVYEYKSNKRLIDFAKILGKK